MRATSRILKGVIDQAKTYSPGTAVFSGLVALKVTAVGKASDPRWALDVDVTNNGSIYSFRFADDAGNVKLFSTIDAVIKAVSQFSESNDGVYVIEGIDTMALYASKVPADIYSAAEAKIVKLNKLLQKQLDKRTSLQSLIDAGGAYFGWDSGNAAQKARHADTVERIAVVNGDYNAISTEIASLNSLLSNRP